MKYIQLLIIPFLLMGCIEDTSSGDAGGISNPRTIIETGYLRCGPNPDRCDAELSCETSEGEQVCVTAEENECSGQATCDCEGQWVCGERPCVDIEGGFECRGEVAEMNPDGGLADQEEQRPECQPDECGPALPVVNYCGDGSVREQRCRRNDEGICSWLMDDCVGRNCAGDPTPLCEERAEARSSGTVRCILMRTVPATDSCNVCLVEMWHVLSPPRHSVQARRGVTAKVSGYAANAYASIWSEVALSVASIKR